MYGGRAFQTNFVGFLEGFSSQPPSGGDGGGNNVGSGDGDMKKSVYDKNLNNKVDLADDALKVNGKTVELNVDSVPVSALEASDDWDSI